MRSEATSIGPYGWSKMMASAKEPTQAEVPGRSSHVRADRPQQAGDESDLQPRLECGT